MGNRASSPSKTRVADQTRSAASPEETIAATPVDAAQLPSASGAPAPDTLSHNEVKQAIAATLRDEGDGDECQNNQLDDDDDDDDGYEEDPLQYFRRLTRGSSCSSGEGTEADHQDLFMTYTQALLLKEGGDYAAAR